MKPKVRIYDCSSWPSAEYRGVNLVKEETPMDLSVKRHSPEHSINSFHIHPDDSQHRIPPDLLFNGIAPGYPLYNSKYGEASSNLLPYLLSHNDYETNSLGHRLSMRHEKIDKRDTYPDLPPLHGYTSYNGVRCSHTNYALKQYLHSKRAVGDYGSVGGSPKRQSPSSSVGSNTYCETKRLLETQLESPNTSTISTGRSQAHKQRNSVQRNLVKSSSESTLNTCPNRETQDVIHEKRWRSESNLVSSLKASSDKMLRYSDALIETPNEVHDLSKKHSSTIGDYNYEGRSVRINSNEMRSDDEEMVNEGFEPENALDLRVSNSALPEPIEQPDLEQEYILRHIQALITNASAEQKRLLDPSGSIHPLEIYKQYYYYLMNQPSRTAFAATVAQVYNKLMSTTSNVMMRPPMDDYGHKYKTDGHLEGFNGHAELRSADTTNGSEFSPEKKRITRPLTGRHVRHGTGASPSTLMSLRQMIQERQRIKELGLSSSQNKQKSRKNQKRK